ncbi:MAG: PTS sugar transporter subunit IIA [Magnetococcales bacterium]|nr:PTS sugar transporter subunit IIA [Magnetococcales bacterium]
MAKLISKSRLVPDLAAKDKEMALSRLSTVVAEDMKDVSSDDLFAALMERERVSTTGIGQGIAIPHGKLSEEMFANAKRACPIAALGRIPSGMDFESMDGRPVHFIVALFSPIHDNRAHLQALATISRQLRSKTCQEQLMAADSPKALYQAMVSKT